jgi:NarL family two-component system response regulator LiaR
LRFGQALAVSDGQPRKWVEISTWSDFMSEQKPIRILLVDDHDMVRRGLAVFLLTYEDLLLVGEAANGVEALEKCAELKPDVILMDLMMPVMDGVAAIKLVREHYPATQVIALTSFSEEKLVEASLQAGAVGFLYKNATVDEMAAAIRAARVGQPTLAPEATRVLIRKTTQPVALGEDLTNRERDILKLLVEGCSNPEIAKQLNLSRSTVKTHVSHIYEKLGATSRVEAVTLAIRHNLLA